MKFKTPAKKENRGQKINWEIDKMVKWKDSSVHKFQTQIIIRVSERKNKKTRGSREEGEGGGLDRTEELKKISQNWKTSLFLNWKGSRCTQYNRENKALVTDYHNISEYQGQRSDPQSNQGGGKKSRIRIPQGFS